MSLHFTPDEAANLGIITKAQAEEMKRESKAHQRGRRHSAARRPAKDKATGIDPQQILFESLCDRLPGLPQLEKQGLVPGRRFRADIFIPPNIVVEFDGFRYHSSKSAFQADRQRENLLVAHGYRVFRTYAKEVFDIEARARLVDLIAGVVEVACPTPAL